MEVNNQRPTESSAAADLNQHLRSDEVEAADRQASTLSGRWLTRFLTREDVMVTDSDVVHEGWVQKRSRYLRLWRRRWMILTRAGELLTFEHESTRGCGHATGRFLLRGHPKLEDLGQESEHVLLTVAVQSSLVSCLLKATAAVGGEVPDVQGKRTVNLRFDAGDGNGRWHHELSKFMAVWESRQNRA
eukprot:TRINITY_DN102215_c0_g1_i1.p1 TRINITY_DN102215_c0_g1~~TRINITY_DN102215_c0_g1_i1.p1  ORF type:complete len:188 (-),score=27.38 TRINITY_DN102215_c0_g1_i1:130-693(-)